MMSFEKIGIQNLLTNLKNARPLYMVCESHGRNQGPLFNQKVEKMGNFKREITNVSLICNKKVQTFGLHSLPLGKMA